MEKISGLMGLHLPVIYKRIQEDQCPYCGADKQSIAYDSPEIDGRDASQACSCVECEGEWSEVYRFHRVLLNDEKTDELEIIRVEDIQLWDKWQKR